MTVLPQPDNNKIEAACEFLHDAYEGAALSSGWQTQKASQTSWDDLPIANKATMRVAVAALFREVVAPALAAARKEALEEAIAVAEARGRVDVGPYPIAGVDARLIADGIRALTLPTEKSE